MRLVIIIPAYNEEKSIARVIDGIPRKLDGIDDVKVLVVNDGSTDSTVEQAKKADKIISHTSNRGVGAAFKDGIDGALGMRADIIVSIDADGQFATSDIPRLIKPIIVGEADFVTGSRFMSGTDDLEMPWIKQIGNQFFTRLVSFLTGHKFTDTQCGLRAYSREAALRINVFGEFTYTQEVMVDLVNKGMRVKEIGIVVGQRKGKSRVVAHWYSYGFKALAISLRTFRDYKPLRFFGSISLLTLLPGIGLGVFALCHWLTTGATSPYTSLIYVSGMFIILSLLFFILALMADMIGRQRKIQEELFYHNKLQRYGYVDRQNGI